MLADAIVSSNAGIFDLVIGLAVALFVLVAFRVIKSDKIELLAAALAVFAAAFLWL